MASAFELRISANKWRLVLRKSLLVKLDKPFLKRTTKPFPLEFLMIVLFSLLHDCQVSFYYMLVLLLYVLTEVGYVLNVML